MSSVEKRKLRYIHFLYFTLNLSPHGSEGPMSWLSSCIVLTQFAWLYLLSYYFAHIVAFGKGNDVSVGEKKKTRLYICSRKCFTFALHVCVLPPLIPIQRKSCKIYIYLSISVHASIYRTVKKFFSCLNKMRIAKRYNISSDLTSISDSDCQYH